MKIEEIENEIINEFGQFDEWLDKYNYLIELGKTLPLIDEQYKTEQYVISGCQSKVWLHATYKDGKIFFEADSDAIITKGIVGLLIRVLSGQTPVDILNSNLEFVDQIGLREHLSPTRSNGLTSMIKQMKLYALAFKTKYTQDS
ncbi:MAG TPA: SufE family protein [Bacteroidales bacterium]|nr:SufE family protein [Bacteroidales bacterium]HPS16483.1 SufE family protein [Bacteroidales bacterium]